MPIVEHEYLKALDLADEWRIAAQPHIEDPGVNSPSNDFWRLTEDLVTWCDLHHINGGILWEVYRQIVACRRPDPDGYIGPRQSHATMKATYRKALDLLYRVQNLAMKHTVNHSKDSSRKPTAKKQAEKEQDTTRAKCCRILKKITGWLLKKTSHLIGAIFVAIIGSLIVAILIDISYDFGWLERIKDVIYKIFQVN